MRAFFCILSYRIVSVTKGRRYALIKAQSKFKL